MLEPELRIRLFFRGCTARLGAAATAIGFVLLVTIVGTACRTGQNGALDAVSISLQANPLAGCTMCHVDVEDRLANSRHFVNKVGCQTCHGPSEGHLADENNEVKPDQLFTRENVDRLCKLCHECSRPHEALKAPEVCVDCHGHHDPAYTPGSSP